MTSCARSAPQPTARFTNRKAQNTTSHLVVPFYKTHHQASCILVHWNVPCEVYFFTGCRFQIIDLNPDSLSIFTAKLLFFTFGTFMALLIFSPVKSNQVKSSCKHQSVTDVLLHSVEWCETVRYLSGGTSVHPGESRAECSR